MQVKPLVGPGSSIEDWIKHHDTIAYVTVTRVGRAMYSTSSGAKPAEDVLPGWQYLRGSIVTLDVWKLARVSQYVEIPAGFVAFEKVRESGSGPVLVAPERYDLGLGRVNEGAKGILFLNTRPMSEDLDSSKVVDQLASSNPGFARIKDEIARAGPGFSFVSPGNFYRFEGDNAVSDVDDRTLPISELRATIDQACKEEVDFGPFIWRRPKRPGAKSDERSEPRSTTCSRPGCSSARPEGVSEADKGPKIVGFPIFDAEDAIRRSMALFPQDKEPHGAEARLVAGGTNVPGFGMVLKPSESDCSVWLVVIRGKNLLAADVIHTPFGTRANDQRPAVGVLHIWDATRGSFISEYSLLNEDAYRCIVDVVSQSLTVVPEYDEPE